MLHLGNLQFVSNDQGGFADAAAAVAEGAEGMDKLQLVCRLLQVDSATVATKESNCTITHCTAGGQRRRGHEGV